MFEQIIYTSCCKGRMLADGRPSEKIGGLQIYSFSRELLDRLPRVECSEIEDMVATRCLWHPSCEARAYAYSILSDGSALWTCNRESRPLENEVARSFHFSQGFIGNFDMPAAFNMGGTNWLTDDDIRSTEGMSDSVYGMTHNFECSTAPQADFLPLADTLPMEGNLRTHLQNLQNSLGPEICTNNLLACVHWLVEHADSDRTLLVVVSAKHDGISRFPGDDTRLPENVAEAQSVCESIMWMISYLLPAAAVVKIPFTVGMQFSWLLRKVNKYRICVTADESEALQQLKLQENVDIFMWGDPRQQFTPAVQCAVYDQWLVESLNGNSRPLIGFKSFCEHLSGLSASPKLFALASIYQAQCSGELGNIAATTKKVWLRVLEDADASDWHLELRQAMVRSIYDVYDPDDDMRHGFALLKEMLDVSKRYDDILHDTYWTPILGRMEAMLRDTEQDHTDSFVRLLQLQKAAPGVFAGLQSCLMEKVLACVDVPLDSIPNDSPKRQERLDAILCKQSWTGMPGKLSFIDQMLKSRPSDKAAQARMAIYESALFGAAVNQGDLVTLYQAYSANPLHVLKLLERFEQRCEPPAAGVVLLYQALVEMISGVQGNPDATILKAVRNKYPEGINKLVGIWAKKDLRGTLLMCKRECSDTELSKLLKCLIGFDNLDVVVTAVDLLSADYPETTGVAYDHLEQCARRTLLYGVDSGLIECYHAFRKAVPGLRRIYRIELMELVQAFESSSMTPDTLKGKISAWKSAYQGESSSTHDVSIDISYFEPCKNEFKAVISAIQSIVSHAIMEQCMKPTKGYFLFGNNQAQRRAVCDLLDLYILLFVDTSKQQEADTRSESNSEQLGTILQEAWLSELPDIVCRHSYDLSFYFIMYLITWRKELDSLPDSMLKNYRVVCNSMKRYLASPDKLSEQAWKRIMEQMERDVKRTKDLACRDYFLELDAARKQNGCGMLPKQRAGTSPKLRAEMKPVGPEESRSDGIKSIFGKLFGDKKNGR